MYWPVEKSQYNEWRHHPCTQFYRQFIKDWRSVIIATYTETWLNHPKSFEEDKDEARGRILALFECEDIPFDKIEQFYKERENEGEITEHQENRIHSSAVLRQK